MKVLFVYPNITRTKSPQLGICMVAAVARDLGHECRLYDLSVIPAGKEDETFRGVVKEFQPDVIGVSCRSNEWAFVSALLTRTDTGKALLVFGGSHTTVAPEEVIKISDVVVIGEGERTFGEILKRLERGEDLATTPGCWVRSRETITKNEMPELISDLDSLPIPYWDIFDEGHYRDPYTKRLFEGVEVVGAFETSRGCPYNCTYCTNDYVRGLYRGKGKWRRHKSVARIIQEAALFRDKYGLDCVYFIDEVILTTVERITEFSNQYRARIGVPFVFMERPENMTDEKVSLIKEAGARIVSIGIESGDEELRRNLLSRKYKQETVVTAFRTARKHGITTHAFTMIGFPGETEKTYRLSYGLLREARPDTVQTTVFFPLRSTKLYDKVVEEGLFDPGTPMPLSYYDKSSLKYSEKKKSELLRWQFVLSNNSMKGIGIFLAFVHVSPVFNLLVLANKVYRKARRDGTIATIKRALRRLLGRR